MKLDEFRRKVHKDILPDHKVEKSVNSEVEKTHLETMCDCGCQFEYFEKKGDEFHTTCPMCGRESVFYHCANTSCYDIVRVKGLHCEKCKREVITNVFMEHMSKEV